MQVLFAILFPFILQAQRYYRMKLMVVGYGGRGKTTLLKTLMKEKTNKKENRPTVGVVVKDWMYVFKSKTKSRRIRQVIYKTATKYYRFRFTT